MARLLPPEQWFATLPTAYLTASGLITDTGGRVLLVDPNYREHWTLPGGVVEHAEAPHTACEREVAEEVGLEVAAGTLLAVQWSTPRDPRPKAFCSFVFDCGSVPAGTEPAVQAEELDGAAFLEPETALERMHPALAPRLAGALEARRTGHTVYVAR
ncbi:NUDIX domain-containing protein [Nocardiopsis composta]|uniref:ADP-ribose pyrophosphatase YjhB (NUDIX family) n=1 Tax=Nocardiopsis composta TaxID=157465 RepID=A0A7W8QHV4_9ACTN|nr:NUDIX domain-containing protein [Nocardiopsis composta]MBB5430747.1 ADP-ribose pyrophosphatase YjhB (NUDIX family) [Nocardiopsis composta]